MNLSDAAAGHRLRFKLWQGRVGSQGRGCERWAWRALPLVISRLPHRLLMAADGDRPRVLDGDGQPLGTGKTALPERHLGKQILDAKPKRFLHRLLRQVRRVGRGLQGSRMGGGGGAGQG